MPVYADLGMKDPVALCLAAVKHARQVNVRAAPHEALRHDADDGAHFAVEAQLAADDAGVAAKGTLPEFVAENGDGLGAGGGIGRGRSAADERGDAHHLEGVHGAVIAAEALGFAGAGPGDVAPGGSDDAGKHRVAFGDFEKIVDGVVTAVAAAASAHVDAHQAVGLAIGKRIDDHGVNHAVHGGASADAESERAGGHGGKRAVRGQIAPPEAQVAKKVKEPAEHESASFWIPLYRLARAHDVRWL